MQAGPAASKAAISQARVWIPGGSYRMGSDVHYPEEAPARQVKVDGFWIDRLPVTNLAFAAFVEATGWVTVAERPPDPSFYPDLPDDLRCPASLVFQAPPEPVDGLNPMDWWRMTPGASWRCPLGPDSGLQGLWQHPVVHVAWADVEAYALWADADLPTETEWEAAARGGLADAEFAWGDIFAPDGRMMANTWQGQFPFENLLEDGWARTSPVGSFPPNGHGLYDMIGNVWEWTRDWWSTGASTIPSCCTASKPGSGAHASIDPDEGPAIPRRVLKGGSYLCAPSYCRRYRPAARHPQTIDTSTGHIGFRCMVRPPRDARP